jgi:hypothetical protein
VERDLRPRGWKDLTVADPGYDFFATGAPGTADPAEATPPAPGVNRFGTPIPPPEQAPAPPAPAPATMAYAAAPTPVTAAAVPGYHPGEVNQFGTPAALSAVPTGPYAAPGLGAAPIEQPGLVSTWTGPAPEAHAAHAAPATPVIPPRAPADPQAAPVAVSRFGSPIPPDLLVEDPSYAALAFGTSTTAATAYGAPSSRVHRTAEPQRPGAVLAAGIIGIVEGGLLLALGLLGLLGYLALKSQLDLLASSPELAGTGLTASSITNLVLVGVVIVLLIGTGYLVAGIATARGARWGAWALLVVSALNVLYSLYELVQGDGGFGTLVSIGVSGAVVLLLCVSDSMRWLRRA